MAISWTLIVLGALLHGMQCNADDSTNTTPSTVKVTTEDSTNTTVPLTSVGSTISSVLPTTYPTLPTPRATLIATLSTVESTKPSPVPTTPAIPPSSTDSTIPTAQPTTKATSTVQTESSLTSAMQNPPSNPPSPSQNGLFTTQIQPTTAGTTANNSPQNSNTAVITTVPNQGTTNLNKPTTTVGTTQLLSTQTNPSTVSRTTALPVTATSDSKSTASPCLGTMKAQTTTASLTTSQLNKKAITTSTSTPQKPFNHSIDLSSSTEENIVHRACKTLGQKMKGNCTVTVTIHGKQLIAKVIIDADQEIPPENYESPVNRVADNHTLQKDDVKDTAPDTLIAILASCGALVLILCCFAAYCTYHRRSYRKNQQHLTEELQTVENGYHDNPTLEVMEVQPEMQEKKLTMNGEFNDSWIVPIDNLLKEDIPDEEDTHL